MTFSPAPFRDDRQAKMQDWWNIFLFVALVLVMGWAFDQMIIKPRQMAIEAHHTEQKKAIDVAAATGDITPAPRPVQDVVAEGTRLTLQNNHLTATIPLTRGRLDDVTLKNFFTSLEKTDPVRILNPNGTDHPIYTETGWLGTDQAIRVPGPDTVWTPALDNTPERASMTWDNGQGLIFTRTYSLDDRYMITVKDQVQNLATKPVNLFPYGLVTQHGLPADLHPGIVHEGAIGYVGDQYVAEGYGGWNNLSTPRTVTGATGWMGITSRYFFAGLIPDQSQTYQYRILHRPVANPLDTHDRPRYQVDLQGPATAVAPGAVVAHTVHVFVGPKKLRLLEDYEDQLKLTHFDLVVDFGWFYFLTKPFYYALVYLNDWVGNFGVAILVLTLMLRLAVFPLANTSFKSFAKMKAVSPQIQEIQKTWIHDKKRMQEELVKLYSKEKVNPVSGCLPILAQIPIFFAMYKVISVAIEMRHAPFFGWIQDLSAPDPTSILNLFGLLPFDVHSFFHFGIWPCVLFICIMLQVRLSPPPNDRMMQIFFNYYYPVIVCFIMAKFAAGLVIYWTFSAFLSIAQQMIIMHRMNVPIHLFERFKKDKEPEKV